MLEGCVACRGSQALQIAPAGPGRPPRRLLLCSGVEHGAHFGRQFVDGERLTDNLYPGAAGACVYVNTFARVNTDTTKEVDLIDEPSRGHYGTFDVDNFGPSMIRVMHKDFVFSRDVDVDCGYGIDVSHYTENVPWADWKGFKVNYVDVKASQSINGRGGKFTTFWRDAATCRVPYEAYHCLTAGVSGRDQGNYFLKRLDEVGGLKKNQLQPVIDLERDEWGSDFKRVATGRTPQGETIFNDYWDSVPKSSVVETVNECMDTIRSGVGALAIHPIIYTNRSWWQLHVASKTKFDCSVWISDCRKESYINNAPRLVTAHDYYLWQFTDRAHIKSGAISYGRYDCNKLIAAGLVVSSCREEMNLGSASCVLAMAENLFGEDGQYRDEATQVPGLDIRLEGIADAKMDRLH